MADQMITIHDSQISSSFGRSKRRGANFDVNVVGLVNWENQELRFTKVKSYMSETGGHLHSGCMKNHASRMLTLSRHPE